MKPVPEPVKIMGLMSGTSADGLSVALCEAAARAKTLEVVKFSNYPYSPALQAKIISARELKAPELSALNFELGRLWAGMVRKFCRTHKIAYRSIAVIGSHGQTVWHSPSRSGGPAGRPGHTLQVGEASFLAEETGRPVVCDFRPADMAAGGQGAPLIPFLDEYLFGGGEPVALQNIGGVGNIAFVGRGVKTTGFDTGPGNSLMDTAVSRLTGGRRAYDKGGALSYGGEPDRAKVKNFLALPFFRRNPPKSLDRSEFSGRFITKHFGRVTERNARDVLATLNLFTAASIALAFKKFAPRAARELIVSGGGALNPALMDNISALLLPAGVRVRSSSELGLHPLAKEPACFALLAWLALQGGVNHCPSATGAAGPRVLGKILRPRVFL